MNAVALNVSLAPRVRVAPKAAAKPARAARVVMAAQKKESVSVAARQPTLAATTAAVSALVAANPAFAGDLFGPEYAGAVTGAGAVVLLGTGAVAALLLPIITGTLNPVQMAINLGIAEGEVSNERKFKRNGEPMDHGTKFGHKWYNTDAYCNGKYIDFAGTKKTEGAQGSGKL